MVYISSSELLHFYMEHITWTGSLTSHDMFDMYSMDLENRVRSKFITRIQNIINTTTF